MRRRNSAGPQGGLNAATPCAACKLLRRRCAQDCPFSPYFSPHEPQKFSSVHKVFGASNVSKMLMEVPESQRADTANSLVYEANVRLADPVYGCMGAISVMQQQLQAMEEELDAVRAEIMRCKYGQISTNLSSSHATMIAAPDQVSVATGQPAPPPPTSSSSMYDPAPSSATDYSSITSENALYFG